MHFETLATGYCFLEAPRADHDGVWFTDLLLGGLHRWRPGQTVDTFFAERQHIGGVALNADGAVIFGGRGGLSWFDPVSGRSGVLLDAIDGLPLAGANDMLPDRKGGLIFGTLTTADGPGGASPNAIYRLDADGRTTRLVDELKIANGIGLSPDGHRLYHNESLVGMFAYDVLADGTLGPAELLSERSDGDGLAVDQAGCVWSASFSQGEIVRFRPDGSVERRIPVPHRVVTSLCFGGPDWCDLYVTTGGDEGVDALMRGEQPPRQASLLYARSDVPGVPVARTAFRLPPG